MADQTVSGGGAGLVSVPAASGATARWARRAEALALPLGALVVGLLAFGLFLLALGKSPVQFYELVYKAGFGTWFSWQNTLSRAAPLLFAALCVALPARLGLMIIGGEGAIVLGGVAAGGIGAALAGWPGAIAMPVMAVFAMLAGGAWIGAVGALRQKRGVNETISSLLMAYIAIAVMNHLVEGPLRDPASLNKPSTAPLPEALRIGEMPGMDVHYGFLIGVICCVISWVLIEKTTWGFAARLVGGNVRAAQIQGLPVGWLLIGFTALGGAFAGLAGMRACRVGAVGRWRWSALAGAPVGARRWTISLLRDDACSRGEEEQAVGAARTNVGGCARGRQQPSDAGGEAGV